jgi:uncharacterized coiled-coil DUF342 family protein
MGVYAGWPYIFYRIIGNVLMDLASDFGSEIGSLSWDELVASKRQLTSELKEITDKLVDLDRNRFSQISNAIKEKRSAIDSASERAKQIRGEIDKHNADLLAVSDKISKTKNFLSLMESRLPSETEDNLLTAAKSYQAQLDEKKYSGDREKNDTLSRLKDASMKLEAIKATRTIREQFQQLSFESAKISAAVSMLNDERESLRIRIAEANAELDMLYDSKRRLSAEREEHMSRYDLAIKKFDAINTRLDEMSAMRKKQREEYGYNLPSDALFKVKENAKKKLESGSKLSLDELRLLYTEKD